MTSATVGVDVGTSSTKGVLVGPDGTVLRRASRQHGVDQPAPGFFEVDGATWWSEFTGITRELLDDADVDVVAVGVSGMGPCTLLVDEAGEPVRPAILYGVDTRARGQIDELDARLGSDEIVRRCRSALTSQAVGPKLAWIAEHEPAAFARARRLLMPSSYLVEQLTGEYVLDHHSASQSVPLYDPAAEAWHEPWWRDVAQHLEPPALCWPGEIAGRVSASAAERTGLPAGVPVIAGTVDAWAEAVSVGVRAPGELMLMYGTTMFLVAVQSAPVVAPPLWATAGVDPGSHCLAAGMATSGAVTAWLKDVLAAEGYPELLTAAERAGAGANGLVMLPYFAGERTPVEDADARGLIAGLTLAHTRGDLYRAALEATAFAVRHNVEAMRAAGALIERITAVGGGTTGGLWTQIVSDVTGLEQQVRADPTGAALGSAFLAAAAVGEAEIDEWNPVVDVVRPDRDRTADYDRLYAVYRDLAAAAAPASHALATWQRDHAAASSPPS